MLNEGKEPHMKRTALLSIMLLLCLIVQAQHSYLLSNPLAGGQDYHYTANSHITLDNNFKYEPYDGHEAVLTIDAFAVYPPEAGTTGGTTVNNTNGVVGSLGGVVDVSLLGGALYAIPIDLPMGLGGMKPQLSIYYNNQERNGLLGWAWNMGGLSSITRAGSTPYHDGTHGIGDRFCLDGKRLLKTGTGNYGANGTTYRTEQDQMSKIVSYLESSVAGPSYFKVWTADGKIMYYGHSADSKALIDQTNHVNIWLLNKVRDRDGNTMEFHYTIDKDAYWIDEITYSANANDNIGSAFRVAFIYTDRDDIDLAYVGSCVYRKKKLLSKIKVFNGDSEMYTYSFTYQTPNPQQGYYYNLLSSIRLDAGDEHLNPTKIQWSENNYSNIAGNNLKYNVTTNGIPNAFIDAVKFNGDFNGDGFDDVVAIYPNNNGASAKAHVFVNRGISGNLVFEHIKTINLKQNVSWIQVADINGDGHDDILISNRNRLPFPFPDQIETNIYLCRMIPTGGFEFVRRDAPIFSVPSNMVETHFIGDFLGEGMNSILVQSASTDNACESSMLFRYDEGTDDFLMYSFPEHLNASRFFPADFNGDGITEILYQKENGSTAMAQLVQSGNTYHYNEIFTGGPSHWDDCFPGDYNGDGYIDLLLYTANATQKWKIHLTHPQGISNTTYTLPQTFPYSSPGNYQFSLDQPHHTSQYIKVGDFDGNGCSDLALYKDNYFHVFYGPIRANGSSSPFVNSQQISIQAFNLYDNMGVCIGNFLGQERLSFLGPITLSRLPSLTTRQEVNKITDGLGRKTEFKYGYLVENPHLPSLDDFYHVNSYYANHSRHVHSCPVPIRALKELTTYNVSNKPMVTQCYYEGALFHNQGKGFLGFSATRQEDYCDGQLQKKTIRQYEIDYTYDVIHMTMMEEDVYDQHNDLLARSNYFYRIYTHSGNNKVFIPVSNKTIEEFDVDQPSKMLKKEIYETEVETHCSQINKYNEIISVVGQTKGTTAHQNYTIASACEFQETFITTYCTDNLSTWLINRPATTTSIAHRKGDYTDICHHKTFTYYGDQPHRIKHLLDLPNDGSHPEDPLALKTEYQYDPTGNIISQKVSTPNDNQASRQELFEYSKTYGKRLLTKHTDALNQEIRYTYHPVYNYCTSTTDYNELTTTYEQDPLGVTIRIHHPDNTVSCKALRWSNDAYYQWEKKTGQATKANYYAITGDAIRSNSYDIDGNMVLTKIEYDAFGRVSRKSTPYRINEDPLHTWYEYDAHHRVQRIHHQDGSYEDIHYQGNESYSTLVATDGGSQESSKALNIMGWVIKSTDAEGTSVIYDYRADGKPVWSQIEGYDETRIVMEHDAMGNQSSLADPNYGTVNYEHNAFNELTKQISPKHDEILFEYDVLGRIISRTETDKKSNTTQETEWIYGTEPGQRGLLTQINTPNHRVQYTYDPVLRVTKITERIKGIDYHTNYTYDEASRVAGITYPSNYRAHYHYTSEGMLKCITDDKSNDLWKTLETNAMLQPTKFITGNGFVSNYGYDKNTHRLTSIQSNDGHNNVQNLLYEYDSYNNMTSRNDLITRNLELFGYDQLNRLTSVDNNEGHSEFHYDPLGRMISKSQDDRIVFHHADYSGDKPHAVKTAQAPHGVFPQERMDIVYNVFDKVATIAEGTNSVNFEYGYDHQRIGMDENINGKTRSKTYVNGCEYISGATGNAIRTFISGPMGVFAVAETIHGQTKLHYIHKDHLGSWVLISDSEGNIEQENHFDAWGNCTDADNLMFDRGFTGHEHIHGMGLINMNGRLYDPITSSMLSPDNNIQMPDFTQNLNRYAYCLNNPLTYTDPDGNTFVESALIFYILYCTDLGYEFQKYTNALAIHIDLHLSSQQLGVGVDFSFGIPKKYGISYRTNAGASYYWRFFDSSYSGFEFRLGAEWCAAGWLTFSGTYYFQGGEKQTTNSIIIGTYWCDFAYENDFMFNLGKYIPCVPSADNGDRYRSAAARFRITLISLGVNIFTGDPGLDHDDRRTFEDPDANGRETYTISANGDDPDEYRSGLLYVGLGPFKIGADSEKVRNFFQNKLAHDILCGGDSPYFKVLDRPGQTYFYFGTGTGSSLW